MVGKGTIDTTGKADSGTTDLRYDFGHRLMGPVIAEYLMKLQAYISHFDQSRDARVLFVARAGIRIRRALETYLDATGQTLPDSVENFWISRLMIAKGTWQKNKNSSIALIAKEFRHGTLRDLVTAMFRYEGVPKNINLTAQLFNQSGQEFSSFIESGSRASKAVSAYMTEQSELFDASLQKLLGGSEHALLIDTGWQGTAQRLLTEAYPEIDWWGAYFGRSGFPDTDRRYWRNVVGLLFQQDEFDIDLPQTCTILHRHMIEDLFEPNGESIERLVRVKNGHIESPEAAAILADKFDRTTDPVFAGVLDYLAELPADSGPATLNQKAQTAWQEIMRIVVLPTREETEIFSAVNRSADFGKKLKVSLLLPPKKRRNDDTPEKRIGASLWKMGQAAIEYPKEIADPLQRKLAGLGLFDLTKTNSKEVEPLRVKHRRSPRVAIITRTLNRPMFLRRALKSVARQTFDDYIQVVVNDGGDIELARKTIELENCAHHKIILVDNVVNRGMEAASNIGIRAVDSEYIVIHDDDDSWDPEFLTKTVAFLDEQKDDGYGGVVTRSDYVSEEITPTGIKEHGSAPYQGWVQNIHIMEMAIGNFFPPIAFLFRREIYDKIRGFNESYPVLGDWDFNLRYLLEADIGMVHESLANYHHRDRGDTSLFGNSVIADRDKHLEYSAIVRNKFARNMLQSDHPAAAMMVGIGLHFGANRDTVRDVSSRVDNLSHTIATNEGVAGGHADDYWVAMSRYAKAVLNKDRSVLKKIGGFGRFGWKAILPGFATSKGLKGLDWDAIHFLTTLKKKGYEIVSPPDFSEEKYLAMYPDVAAAVSAGQVRSGYDHYFRFGRKEGRQRVTH